MVIADEWCRQGDNHPGAEALACKWRSFDDCDDDTVTIEAIRARVEVHGFDFDEICRNAENDSTPCMGTVESPPNENPLDKFSLNGQRSQLLQDAVKQTFALEPVALMGQATVFYGSPGTGKTLLTLYLTS